MTYLMILALNGKAGLELKIIVAPSLNYFQVFQYLKENLPICRKTIGSFFGLLLPYRTCKLKF